MIHVKLETEMSSDNNNEMLISLGHPQRDMQASMQQQYIHMLWGADAATPGLTQELSVNLSAMTTRLKPEEETNGDDSNEM